jgi:hypothetical protein
MSLPPEASWSPGRSARIGWCQVASRYYIESLPNASNRTTHLRLDGGFR